MLIGRYLVQDENGTYRVEHRLHDVGTALGRSSVLVRSPRDVLNWRPMSKSKPEEYDRNYVWSDRKGNISLLFVGMSSIVAACCRPIGLYLTHCAFLVCLVYMQHLRDHSGATYSDFKWAARLIASLTQEEI